MMYHEESGWWLPDNDDHLKSWLVNVNDEENGRLLYQGKKLRAAMEYVKVFGTALDIGAYAGLWTWPLSHRFQWVSAFEPIPEHCDCWRANLNETNNTMLYRCALGDREGIALMSANESMKSSVDDRPDGSGKPVPLRKLDDFIFRAIDFLKVDCEGYELFVLQGAEKHLKKFKPVVIVEQKVAAGMTEKYDIPVTAAVDYLVSLGATVRKEMLGDYILSW